MFFGLDYNNILHELVLWNKFYINKNPNGYAVLSVWMAAEFVWQEIVASGFDLNFGFSPLTSLRNSQYSDTKNSIHRHAWDLRDWISVANTVLNVTYEKSFLIESCSPNIVVSKNIFYKSQFSVNLHFILSLQDEKEKKTLIEYKRNDKFFKFFIKYWNCFPTWTISTCIDEEFVMWKWT